jgi:hypothetical protein
MDFKKAADLLYGEPKKPTAVRHAMNVIEPLLTDEEINDLIQRGLMCCGSFDSESACCPFRTRPSDEAICSKANQFERGRNEI